MCDASARQSPAPGAAESTQAATSAADSLASAQTDAPLFSSRGSRWQITLAGVALPALCCLLSFPSNWFDKPVVTRVTWENHADLAVALMSHVGMAPLYPFLIYSMIGLEYVAVSGRRELRRSGMRFGVYSGVILSAEYWGLFIAALVRAASLAEIVLWGIVVLLTVTTITLVLTGVIKALCAAWRGFRGIALVTISVGSALCFAGALAATESFALAVLLLAAIPLFCATTWCLIAYTIVAVRLWRWRRQEADGGHFSLAQLLAVVGWFAAHCAAWRLAVQMVLSGNAP